MLSGQAGTLGCNTASKMPPHYAHVNKPLQTHCNKLISCASSAHTAVIITVITEAMAPVPDLPSSVVVSAVLIRRIGPRAALFLTSHLVE